MLVEWVWERKGRHMLGTFHACVSELIASGLHASGGTTASHFREVMRPRAKSTCTWKRSPAASPPGICSSIGHGEKHGPMHVLHVTAGMAT